MEKLATTTRKLALVSKEADKIGRCLVLSIYQAKETVPIYIKYEINKIGRERRTWENKTEENALELENLENALKTAKSMGEQFLQPKL